MWSPEDLAVIRDRVIRHWVTDRDPAIPLLVEREPKTPAETCQRGHQAMATRKHGKRYCRECRRLWFRTKRATLKATPALAGPVAAREGMA